MNTKRVMILALVALIVVGGLYVASAYMRSASSAVNSPVSDYKDGTYYIGQESVTLKDGVFEAPAAPNSASMIKTHYFGNEARGDLDGDEDEDIVFILTQTGGGTGTYFYLVAALKEESGYRGSQAVLIGDRIAPQTTEFKDGLVTVNYADRNPDEAMAIAPSVGKSLRLKYDAASNSFGEVVQDFEGEADPERMTLRMKAWEWISSTYADGSVVTPQTSGKFTLTFKEDGTFSAGTDCNQAGGRASADDSLLTLSDIFSTRMYCEGSQESEFLQMLENVSRYSFTSKGELILSLKLNSGTSTFK